MRLISPWPAICLFLTLVMLQPSLQAGDWPQILGPHRNGIADGEHLADAWPKGKLVETWEQPVGEGLAGVAVVGEDVILFHRLDDEEVVAALNIKTGKSRWEQRAPTKYSDQINGDSGPRCVPLVQAGKVYTYGAEGRLSCDDLQLGKRLWTVALAQKYGASTGYFGAGSTPVFVDGKIIVNVGADRANAGMVAVNAADGAEVWKVSADSASYSAPIVTELAGRPTVIAVTRLQCLALDPQTGKILWEFPFGKRGPTVNGATPVLLKDKLLLTASYGIGATFAKIDAKSAEELWNSDEILSSQYVTPIVKDGLVYGIDGRDDIGVASLRCFDPETRKIHWTVDGFGTAPLILAGDILLAMKTDGTLIAGKISPKKFTQLGEYRLFSTTTRPLPALANGQLFVRDQRVLKCVPLPTAK